MLTTLNSSLARRLPAHNPGQEIVLYRALVAGQLEAGQLEQSADS